jgi:integrase/recombinase XerD
MTTTRQILCPRCSRRYPAPPLPATPEDFTSDVGDSLYATACPHCGKAIDLRQLQALTMRDGILYIDQIIYPGLILANPPPIDQNPAASYLYRLTSDQSRRVMTQGLRTIAALLTGQDAQNADILALHWGGLRKTHTSALRDRLVQLYSGATARRILSALRGVLKEAWRLGQMSAEDYQRAIDLDRVQTRPVTTEHHLTAEELLKLVTTCQADASPAGTRDAAIIGALYAGGLRRTEAALLDFADLKLDEGCLTIRDERDKVERKVYLNAGTLAALADWLENRGDGEGALFTPVNKGGGIQQRRMSAQAIYNLIQKRAEAAGIPNFSPNDLRRAFISDLFEQDTSPALVQQMAGHANLATTTRYDRRSDEAKRRAAASLNFPYQRDLSAGDVSTQKNSIRQAEE